jgi:hypothetical protein
LRGSEGTVMPEAVDIPEPSPARSNIIVRFWRGEERLWKAYWLVGVLGSNIVNGITWVLIDDEIVPVLVAIAVIIVYALWAPVSI